MREVEKYILKVRATLTLKYKTKSEEVQPEYKTKSEEVQPEGDCCVNNALNILNS